MLGLELAEMTMKIASSLLPPYPKRSKVHPFQLAAMEAPQVGIHCA